MKMNRNEMEALYAFGCPNLKANKISIGTVTMASAISKIPIRKMSCLPLLKMWNSFFIVSGIVIL